MNVLVACEESQVVCLAFREIGHNAYSCDIQECSGGHPEWHINQDVIPLLDGNCAFITMDGRKHVIKGKWDLIIAFPPCTHLAVSGAKWFEKKRNNGQQLDAIKFFCEFLRADCEHIAVENPVGIISGNYLKEHFPIIAEAYKLPIKPTQVIHPYMFGDPYEKRTCLWLKGLPNIVSNCTVEPPLRVEFKSGRTMPKWYADAWKLPPAERAKFRSRTFPGIANAMAEQWSKIIT